ncbi:rCG49244 [Rattus norvegicus]|uniref:RCG49244 n=1 Tax=Rattus norvegicus TaxID=10116 RepID=A6J2H4_RAT|nr:rCG49244 [Rattus norvegicus]
MKTNRVIQPGPLGAPREKHQRTYTVWT